MEDLTRAATPPKLTYKAVPWVGTLKIHGARSSYLTFTEKVTLGAEI